MNKLATATVRMPVGPRWGLWDEDLDTVVDRMLRPIRSVEEASQDLVPALDIMEHEEEFVIRADVPGVRKEDISVTMEDGVLTLSAERASEINEDKDNVLRRERRYGKFVRSLRLGTQVDEKKVKASYRDGVLELVLPKAEAVKPRKIAVDVG